MSFLLRASGNITSPESLLNISLCKMEARDMKINHFNGKGNVVEFLKKMELHVA